MMRPKAPCASCGAPGSRVVRLGRIVVVLCAGCFKRFRLHERWAKGAGLREVAR
jgi:hypothetical protein